MSRARGITEIDALRVGKTKAKVNSPPSKKPKGKSKSVARQDVSPPSLKALSDAELQRLSCALWTEAHRVLRGQPFSLSEYPFLLDIYDEVTPEVTIMKGAQLGVSEMAINRVLWFCDHHKGRHAIYTFPSLADMREFSQTRIKPAILESAYFKNRIRREHIDNMNLKQFGSSFVHFRGTFTETQTISIPSEYNIHDELDFSRPDVVEQYRSRLEASKIKWTWKLSTPTLPGYGIHRSFLKSNQQHWLVKCDHCTHKFALCCAWPEAVSFGKSPEKDCFVCPKCRKPISIDIRAKGEWIAEKQRIKNHAGYHLSQLMSLSATATSFRDQGGYKWKKQFNNFKLGKPYGAKGVCVNRDTVLACENKGLKWKATGDHCLIGVDQADETWAIVGDPNIIPGKLAIVAIEKIENDDEKFEQVAAVMKVYNVDLGVIDAEPNKKSALALCKSFPDRMYACFYSDRQKQIHAWPDGQPTVTVNRTDTLDISVDAIRDRMIQLPPLNDQCEFLIKHLENHSKQEITDEETGLVRARYVQTGPTHLAHAFNYLLIAYGRWLTDKDKQRRGNVRAMILSDQRRFLRRLAGAPVPKDDRLEVRANDESKRITWTRLELPGRDAAGGSEQSDQGVQGSGRGDQKGKPKAGRRTGTTGSKR